MNITSQETQVVEVVKDILCNKCGESCSTGYNYEGLIGAVVVGGYGSKHLGDMERYVFDVCERCLVDFFGTFKVDPRLLEPWEKESEGDQ